MKDLLSMLLDQESKEVYRGTVSGETLSEFKKIKSDKRKLEKEIEDKIQKVSDEILEEYQE